jgi:hypothetical protein
VLDLAAQRQGELGQLGRTLGPLPRFEAFLQLAGQLRTSNEAEAAKGASQLMRGVPGLGGEIRFKLLLLRGCGGPLDRRHPLADRWQIAGPDLREGGIDLIVLM